MAPPPEVAPLGRDSPPALRGFSFVGGIEEEESFFGGEEKLGFLRYCCEEKREPNQYYAWLRVPLRVVTISTSDEKTDANHEKDREEEDES